MAGVGNLFAGMGPGAAGAPARQQTVLTEFRAGRMVTELIHGGPRLRIKADPRKGKVMLVRKPGGTVHFQWRDRMTNATEEDAPLFPGDAKMLKVDTGRSGDRVLRLEFSNQRRLFFWMQEPKPAGDAKAVKTLNDMIENPPAAAPAGGAAGGRQAELMAQLAAMRARGGQSEAAANQLAALLGGGGGQGGGGDLGAMMGGGGGGGGGGELGGYGGMSEEEQLARALEASMAPAPAPAPAPTGAPSGPAPTTPSPSQGTGGAGGALTADMMAGFMSEAMGLLAAEGNVGAAAALAGESGPTQVPLRLLVTPDTVDGVMGNEAAVEALLPHLPPSQQTPEHLRSTLASPQFQQALGSLGNALQGGNFNTIFANFGLDPAAGGDALAQGDAIGAFIAALQAAAGGAPAAAGGEGGDAGEGGEEAPPSTPEGKE